MIYTTHQMFGDQIQANELRGAYGTYTDEEKCKEVLGEISTWNTLAGYTGIILNLILMKKDRRVCNGFSSLWLGITHGLV